MRISKIKIHYLAPLLLAVSIGLYWGSVSSRHGDAVMGTGCAAYYITVDGSNNVATALNGLHQLNLLSSYSTNIRSVVFTIDSIPLGRGQPISGSTWGMPWYTQAATYGGHAIGAQVSLDNGVNCSVPSISALTNNPTTSQMSTIVAPTSFSAQTNEALNFTLNNKLNASTSGGVYAPYDVTAYTVFQKNAPTLGILTPADTSNIFRFSAGTSPGSGSINVVAFYGGSSKPIGIPVIVYPQPTSGTNTTNTTPSGGITTNTATGSQTPTNTSPTSGTSSATTDAAVKLAQLSSAASIESNPVTKTCTVTALTEKRYIEIKSGKSRPTAVEFEALNKCFADRNFVLPTSFVPIAPSKVDELPESASVKIAGATNGTKKAGTTDITTLKFFGKAKPNSIVLLYVHSEPLVLSTTADKNGDWNYALQDPLESGKHEVYAVVDKGNGSYQRSSIFSFVIAKASASSVNPKGYNLKIASIKPTATENNRSYNTYIAASFSLILLVLAALFITLRIKHRKHLVPVVAASTIPSTSQDSAPNPSYQPESVSQVTPTNTYVPPQPQEQSLPTQPTSSTEPAPQPPNSTDNTPEQRQD